MTQQKQKKTKKSGRRRSETWKASTSEHNKHNKNISVTIFSECAVRDAAWGSHGAYIDEGARCDPINYGPGGYKRLMKDKEQQGQVGGA